MECLVLFLVSWIKVPHCDMMFVFLFLVVFLSFHSYDVTLTRIPLLIAMRVLLWGPALNDVCVCVWVCVGGSIVCPKSWAYYEYVQR